MKKAVIITLVLLCLLMGGRVYAQCLGNIFTDVNENTVSAWMCEYIERFSTLGITEGYPDGTYRPANNVTRGQMATFIMRTIDNVITAGSCAEGSSIRQILGDGSVVCEIDDTGATPSGSVTSLDGASSAGAATTYSRGDHKHGIMAGAITSSHILNETITNADVSPTAAIDIAKLSGVASSTHNHDATYVNEGQANSISSGMIQNSVVTKGKLSAAGGTSGQVLGTDGTNLLWQSGSTAGGWVDDGDVVRLATGTDNVGIGTATPGTKLDVGDLIRVRTTTPLGNPTFPTSGAGMELAYNNNFHLGYIQVYGRSGTVGWGNLYLGDGNVGIGNTGPTEKLVVEGNLLINNGAANKSLRLRTTAAALDFDIHGNNLYVNGDTGYIMVVTHQTRNVGIGIEVPSSDTKLHVVNASSGGYGIHGQGSVGVLGTGPGVSDIGVLGYAPDVYGTAVMGNGDEYDFLAIGPGENYAVGSSIRWKRNIQEIDGALDKIMSLRGVYFDWDAEHGGKHDMGFIAEEVGEVIPEIVGYEPDGVYAIGVDYGAITPMLVQAIKEQQRQIGELKAQIDELKRRLD